MTQILFSPLFNPNSITVRGASDKPGKIGYQSLKTLIDGGFEGDIYPINPNLSKLLGLKVFPSVDAIPGNVDMAVFVVPAHLTPDLRSQCAEKGIRGSYPIRRV